MTDQIDTRMEGWFSFSIYNPETDETRVVGPFKNLITNAGLDWFGNLVDDNASPFPFVQVGSSGTTPAFTDTALGAYVAGQAATSATQGTWNSTGSYYSGTWTYTFTQGAAAGNLAEVGTASAASGGTLISHALILDTGGNPTVIVVSSIEILTVNYEFRSFPKMTDTTGTIVLNGVTYTYTLRPSFVTAPINTVNPKYGNPFSHPSGSTNYFDGPIGTTTAGPSGNQVSSTSTLIRSAYTNGTHYRDHVLSLSITQGNLTAGIGSIGTTSASASMIDTGMSRWQIGFSPNIPKDNTKTLSLTFRFGWSR